LGSDVIDESGRVFVGVSEREVVAISEKDVVVVSNRDVLDVSDGDVVVGKLYTALDELVQFSRLNVLDKVRALASIFSEVVPVVLEESV